MAHRRIIVQEIVSLDGFVADPLGGLDFFEAGTDFSEADQENLSIMASVDTILLGAKTYRLFLEHWPTAEDEPVADIVNSVPKIVFSSTLDSAPWVDSIRPASSTEMPLEHVRRLRQETPGLTGHFT